MANNIDNTKTGPSNYKDLQEANNSNYTSADDFLLELQNRYNAAIKQSNPYRDIPQNVKSPLYGTSTPWGESRFDNRSATEAEFQNLGDVRAENQSGISKIANGLAKGAVLAGTTFLDGTVGLAYGIGTAINEGRWSGLWDNDFSKAMQEVNEWSEQAIPNYYSSRELNAPWYENIFTANFIGDKFIKNLGFTVGALYSGLGESAILQGVGKLAMKGAIGLGKSFSTVKAIAKASDIVASGVGAFTSALNEGRIEALNNSKDWFNYQKSLLDDAFGVTNDDTSYLSEEEFSNYNALLEKLSDDRLKMGNVDLLMNLPILMASNILEFGKLYSGGFKTAKKATNIVGKLGNYSSALTKKRLVPQVLKNALSEGTEEISQKVASNIAGNYYGTDVNNFYKSLTDRDASKETLSWIQSFAKGINDTVNDGSSWEEFFIGALTGAMGVPQFRSMKNSEGKFQSPITVYNEAYQTWKEHNKAIETDKQLAEALNARFNSPEFKNYYQGLVRHNKFQNDMNEAAAEGNQLDYNNAEHAQLVSDIIMWDKAGKIEDLFTAIKESADYSDEELQSIFKNTTKTLTVEEQKATINNNIQEIDKKITEYQQLLNSDEVYLKRLLDQRNRFVPKNFRGNGIGLKDSNGAKYTNPSLEQSISHIQKDINERKDRIRALETEKINLQDRMTQPFNEKYVGPFVDESGNPMYSTEEGKKTMIDKLTKNTKEITDTINKYINIKTELTTDYGDKLTDDQVKELTWMKSQLDNWKERSESIADNVKKGVGKMNYYLGTLLEQMTKFRDFSGKVSTNPSEEYEKTSDSVNKLQKIRQSLELIESLPKEVLPIVLGNNEKTVDDLIYNLNIVEDSVIDKETKDSVIKDLKDIVTLSKFRETYSNKLREYLDNPKAMEEAHKQADAQTAQEEENDAVGTLKDSLKKANTLQDFRKEISKITDKNIVDKAIKELGEEGDQRVNDYLDTNTYYNSLLYQLRQTSPAPAQVKRDAIQMLNNAFNNSQNLQELANPNSIYYTDESVFESDSDNQETALNRFREAQYELLSAINKANNNNKFKDRFSDEYKKPPKKVESPKGVDKDITGSSETPTVPSSSDSQNGGTQDSGTQGSDGQQSGSKPEVKEDPYGDIPSVEVASDNSAVNEGAEESPKVSKDTEANIYSFYRPAIPEFHIEASRVGDFRPFPEVALELEGLSFNEIYNHLSNNGAFDYINSGNLKVGDEVGFMIDPEFEDKVKDKSWHTAPTVFLISKKDNHIIGSLDEGDSIGHFKGLQEVIDKVRSEYANNSTSKDRFIATPTTKVSKVIGGKIVFGKQERSLKELKEISVTNPPIFGIVKNGVLYTNQKLNNSQVVMPFDMRNKEGRLFMLIPNGAGKYVPASIRVKHFNKNEFDLDKTEVNSTPIGKAIMEGFNQLARATTESDRSKAVQILQTYLNFKDVLIDLVTDRDKGDALVLTKFVRNPDGTKAKTIYNGDEVDKRIDRTVYISERPTEVEYNGMLMPSSMAPNKDDITTFRDVNDILKELIESIYEFNVPIQVSLGKINSGNYNMDLVNSDVLTSNLQRATIGGAWFTTDYIEDGEVKSAVNPPMKNQKPSNGSFSPSAQDAAPATPVNPVINGTLVNLASSGESFYVDGDIIRDKNGKDITDSIIAPMRSLIKDLAYAQETYGDLTAETNFVVIPNTRKVLNRMIEEYLDDSEAEPYLLEYDKKYPPATPASPTQSGADLANDLLAEDYEGESDDDNPLFRKTNNVTNYPVWDKKAELDWLNKVLPQLREQDRVNLVQGLIKVAKTSEEAWGQFDGSIVTLSDIAAEGTAYHEAFHVVFNLLLDDSERKSLLKEYSEKHPNNDSLSSKVYNIVLEEQMAEDFREFVMQGGRDTRSLGRKIIDFFKALLSKVKYWKDFRPSSIYYFRRINEGKYANDTLGSKELETRYSTEEYTQEMKNILAKAPRDSQGRLLAPNGKVSNLTERQYAQVRTKAFKNWFGNWENVPANITEEELQTASLIFDRVPELAEIGTPAEYAAYIKEIFPNSVEKEVYWHGSNEDFSKGFLSAKRGEGSGALETKKRNDLYLNKQGWASIQYVDGINRKGRDKNGFGHWNKLWWELKEIMSNGRRENNDWKNIVIDESTIRQAIPNKKGIFNRDSGGKNGKWLSERKADYGYENKSDKEFFEEIFGIKLGKDTFNTWTARNAEIFKSLEKSAKGIYPVVIDVRNPIIEEGQNTYYEEQRGLFTVADSKGNDAILSKKADNEFNSDVAVVINANNDNVYWLGTKSDIERFRQWKINNDASKVVDENGEPLVVYHGTNAEFTVFDNSKSDSSYKGFYFTDSKEMAGSYKGDILMPVFLNIRDYYKVNASGKSWNNISTSIAGDNSNSALEWLENIVKQNSLELEQAKRGAYDILSGKYIKNEKRIKEVQEFLDNLGVTKLYNEYKNVINSSPYSTVERVIKYFKLKSIEHKATKLFNDNYYRYRETNFVHTRDLETVFSDRDGIIIKDVIDYGSKVDNALPNDVYIVYNPSQIKSATDNIGTFDPNNPDIRYRKVPTIAQLRAQEKSEYDRFNNNVEAYYRRATEIIRNLNYKRFNTREEAMKAFAESGIRRDFFYKLTRAGANNAAGYKIQLLTRDMVEQYKRDNNPFSKESQESIPEVSIDYSKPTENFKFDSLDPEVQMMLLDGGWTKEKFDSISQAERDHAILCAAY